MNRRHEMFRRQLLRFSDYEQSFCIINDRFVKPCYIKDYTGSDVLKSLDIYLRDFFVKQGDMIELQNQKWLVLNVDKDYESTGYDVAKCRRCDNVIYINNNGSIYTIPFALNTRIAGRTDVHSTSANVYTILDNQIEILYSPTNAIYGVEIPEFGIDTTEVIVNNIKYRASYVTRNIPDLYWVMLDSVSFNQDDDRRIGVPGRWIQDPDGNIEWTISGLMRNYDMFSTGDYLQLEPLVGPGIIDPSRITWEVSNPRIIQVTEPAHSLGGTYVVQPLQGGRSFLTFSYNDANGVPYVQYRTQINCHIGEGERLVVDRIETAPDSIYGIIPQEIIQLSIQTIATNGQVIFDSYLVESSDNSIIEPIWSQGNWTLRVKDKNGLATITVASMFDPSITKNIPVEIDMPLTYTYRIDRIDGDGNFIDSLPASNTWTVPWPGNNVRLRIWTLINGVVQLPEFWNINFGTWSAASSARISDNAANIVLHAQIGSRDNIVTFSDPNGVHPNVTATIRQG